VLGLLQSRLGNHDAGPCHNSIAHELVFCSAIG
jgi:hypothetical protein